MTASKAAPITPPTSRTASPASMARAPRRSAPASPTFPSSRRCSPTSPRRSSIGRLARVRSNGRTSPRSRPTSRWRRRRPPALQRRTSSSRRRRRGRSRYLKNQHYPSEEAYLYALADVMAREYRAIVDAGLVLQLDCPDLALSRHMVFAHLRLEEFRKVITTHVEALNHAVRDIPPERMRMHICWASTQGPHHKDVPLKDIVDIVLKGRPQALSFPGANPRHGHEWKVWKNAKLPDGKIIIPGVIDSTSNFVEHPELVADRSVQYPRVVGAQNVIAGVDCGFGTFAGRLQVDSKIVWMKLASLTEGARLASKQLW